MCPPNTIERLLKHEKEVAGGVYYNMVQLAGKARKVPVLMTYPNEELKKAGKAEWAKSLEPFNAQLVKVACIGLGCVLISRSTLEKISFRIVENDFAFDDMHFAIDLQKNNIPCYADTSILCEHHFNEAFRNVPDEKY